MRTGALVVGMTAAGVIGGIVGALMTGDRATPQDNATPVASAAPMDDGTGVSRGDLEELRARLDVMEADLTESRQRASDLQDRLEQERAEKDSLVSRMDTLENERMASGNLPTSTFRGQTDVPMPSVIRMGNGVSETWKRVHELRSKTEEERWQSAREALGLTLQQEEELKAALKERKDAMKDAIKEATTTSMGDNGRITLSMPDPEKMREAGKRYNDRVDAALNAEQATKWRDDGYETAMGGGGGGAHFVSVEVDK